MTHHLPPDGYWFGPFRLDSRTRDLWRGDVAVSLARGMTELSDETDLQYAESGRVFHIVRFMEGSGSVGLGVSEPSLAMKAPGSVAAMRNSHDTHWTDDPAEWPKAAVCQGCGESQNGPEIHDFRPVLDDADV